MDKWDSRYVELAKHVAQWSRDSTQMGAVIPSDHYTAGARDASRAPPGRRGDVDLTPGSATEVRAVRGRMPVRLRRLEPFWASSGNCARLR
jgi:hypothetical protein